MTTADFLRKSILDNILTEGKSPNNRVSATFKGTKGLYTEIITLDEIREVTGDFKDHGNLESFLEEFVHERLSEVFDTIGYVINENELDLNSTNTYDGYELNVPLKRKPYQNLDELFNEIDEEINPQHRHTGNQASNTPITKEPGRNQTQHLPNRAKQQKTQNPQKVDFILKNVFESKFNTYELKSDVGSWKVSKSLKNNGKLMIQFESKEHDGMLLEVLIFPKDSNKILVELKTRGGEKLLNTYFEIYRIPTDEFLAEKFFRKTLFNLLKKYIESNVVQVPPFSDGFVFWKTDNPNFSYSFSTPKKNKIVLDLISFISTAQKPILDDFFEQNNLKHKQGYLQTLLDSAEAAGIFQFKREGNEILILRGANYKAFLEGKVRRVTA